MRLNGLLLVALFGLTMNMETRGLSAEELSPGRASRICRAAYQTLHREHVGVAPMPSDLGAAVIDLYLRGLDPRKMHFLQRDVDVFSRQAKELPRQLRRGDLSLMNEIQRVYQMRVRQSHELAMQLADQTLDFHADETIDLDTRNQPYCASAAEHHDRWRKWTKYELLTGCLPRETRDQRRVRLKKRYERFLHAVLDADRDEQLADFLTALAHSFDPQSSFLSPRMVKDFDS